MKILTDSTTVTLRFLIISSFALLIYYYAGKFYSALFLFFVFCSLCLVRLDFKLTKQTELLTQVEKRLNESLKILWKLEDEIQREEYRLMIAQDHPEHGWKQR